MLTYRRRKWLYRILSITAATLLLFAISAASFAQDEEATEEPDTTEEVVEEGEEATEEMAAEEEGPLFTADQVQYNLDMTWMTIAGFLVFFMQAGFAMLEGGFIRRTGVVNSMAENFMDACLTAIAWFIVGYGIAYASTDGGGFIPIPELFLGGLDGTTGGTLGLGPGDLDPFADWFFQFAFAGAAATIATGAMAERTNFIGKIIYSIIVGAIIYPVVVFWGPWGGGWLGEMGMLDFAGSSIVHQTGGVIALVGAAIVGPRVGRVWGEMPKPHNLMLAALGTFILWFGWYGFNVGSTLAASDVHLIGLVAVNTTLAAAGGAVTAMLYGYFTKGGKWDLGLILNGSLAGLVGITAGCAFVSPTSALIIGLIAGVIVVVVMDLVEGAKIDDAVGAFAVHGACGAFGTLAIGLFALEPLAGAAGLFAGGGISLLITQVIAVIAIAIWAAVTAGIMFFALNAAGLLRMHEGADKVGIDQYEHGADAYVLMDIPTPENGD